MARKFLFWSHLVVAVLAGVWLFSMALTGCLLSFEKQLLELIDRASAQKLDGNALTAGLGSAPTSAELMALGLAWRPGTSVRALTLIREPKSTRVEMSDGHHLTFDGKGVTVSGEEVVAAHEILHWIESWHRWFALAGPGREWGKALTGAANLGMIYLILSGIWLWWPRGGKKKALLWRLRPRAGLMGRARQLNLHVSIGFWTTPLLLLMSLTGMVMSYRWAERGLAYLAGERQGGTSERKPGMGERGQARSGARPAEAGAKAGGKGTAVRAGEEREERGLESLVESEFFDVLLNAAIRRVGSWERLTVRVARYQEQAFSYTALSGENYWQRSTLVVDAASGKEIRWEKFEELPKARQWRSWVRPLHTGEALGVVGPFIAFAAAVSCLVLIWSGFSLALIRLQNFLAKRKRKVIESRIMDSEPA